MSQLPKIFTVYLQIYCRYRQRFICMAIIIHLSKCMKWYVGLHTCIFQKPSYRI